MTLLDSIVKGFVTLSLMLVMQQGCSVKDMATKAAHAHKKGLSSYKKYSNQLTGYRGNWLEEAAKKK